MKALALVVLLALASPAFASKPVLLCADQTPTAEDDRFWYFECRFEVEADRKRIIEFRVDMVGAHSLSLTGDYTIYLGYEGIIEECITLQQAWVRAWGARFRVYSTCPGDKYIVVELAVHK